MDPALCLARLAVSSPEDAIKALASALLACGHVQASFEKAALAREKRSPTGLPFAPPAVALPHAEPEHVVSPAIAVATLARPVTFREMGSPGTKLSISIVVMPAFTAKEQASGGLSALIERLQDDALRVRLLDATSSARLAEILGGAP